MSEEFKEDEMMNIINETNKIVASLIHDAEEKTMADVVFNIYYLFMSENTRASFINDLLAHEDKERATILMNCIKFLEGAELEDD